MSDIKKLETKKLIREYLFYKSEYEFKQVAIKNADVEFIKTVDLFLEQNGELRTLYNKKINDRLNEFTKNIDTKDIESSSDDRSVIEEGVGKSCNDESEVSRFLNEREMVQDSRNYRYDRTKRLYRKIVKITHPDVIRHSELNLTYIKATKLYNEEDYVGLYEICDQLHIEYDIEDEIEEIKVEIDNIKYKIDFIENNLTWKWFNESSSNKSKIVFDYIKSQILT
jgi:hypothetical protein